MTRGVPPGSATCRTRSCSTDDRGGRGRGQRLRRPSRPDRAARRRHRLRGRCLAVSRRGHPQPRPPQPGPRPRIRGAANPHPGRCDHGRHPCPSSCGRPVLPPRPGIVVHLHDRWQRRLQRGRPAHAPIRRHGRFRCRPDGGALRWANRPHRRRRRHIGIGDAGSPGGLGRNTWRHHRGAPAPDLRSEDAFDPRRHVHGDGAGGCRCGGDQ